MKRGIDACAQLGEEPEDMPGVRPRPHASSERGDRGGSREGSRGGSRGGSRHDGSAGRRGRCVMISTNKLIRDKCAQMCC